MYVDEAGMDSRDDYGDGWCEAGQRFEALKSGRRTGRIKTHQYDCGLSLFCYYGRRKEIQVPSSCFQVWDWKNLEGVHPIH